MKKNKFLKMISLFLVLTIFTGMAMASSSSGTKDTEVTAHHDSSDDGTADESDSAAISDSVESTQETEETTTTEEKAEVSDSDFTYKEIIYKDSIGYSHCYLVVNNNGDQTVSIEANLTAYDKKDEMVGADSATLEVIGPGEESIIEFYFGDVSGIDHVKYNVTYDNSISYTSGLKDVEFKVKKNKKNVIVTATNNGDEETNFLKAYVFFYNKKGKITFVNEAYITDDDSELKAGASISKQVDAYGKFSKYEVYYTGRRGGWF